MSKSQVHKVANRFLNRNAYYNKLPVDTDVRGVMEGLLALLRAQYWVFQTAHWQAKGSTSYGDHLMFQRLYEGVQKEVDEIAEKTVGYFGTGGVDPVQSVTQMVPYVMEWSSIEDPYSRCLKAEEDLQGFLQRGYDTLKAQDGLTLGLDDYLMSLANEHETNIYLLQQRIIQIGKAL